MRQRVQIVIPTFNHPEFTEKLLASLTGMDHGELDVRIELHDDGSTEKPKGPFPVPVDLRCWDGNLGYVNHVNRILREHYVPGSYLLLLNYDTDFSRAPNDWLPWMVEALDARFRFDHAGAMGPISSSGSFEQRPQELGGLPLVLDPSIRKDLAFGTHPAAILSGFCVLFHPAFLAEMGGFLNPAFSRLAFDDWDLSFRMRKNGWTLWVHHGILVEHDDREVSDRAGCPTELGRRKMAELWGEDFHVRGLRPMRPLDIRLWNHRNLSVPPPPRSPS